MTTALARRDESLTVDEIVAFVRRHIGDHLLDVTHEHATLTMHVDAEGYLGAAEVLKNEDRLAFTMFDCLLGVDAREEGFDVVAVLYAPEFGNRVLLRHRCEGGREEPVAPTLTHLWEGANWHERETWDMFGIEFEDHPGLAPRILTVENFEGWPLRKDFYLASREAKPWPGVKEPAETDDDGNVIVTVPGPGDAPGPMELDKAMAEQAKLANPEAEAETKVLTPEQLEDVGPGGDDVEERDDIAATAAESPEGAEVATDSGQVVAGDEERVAEEVEDAASVARETVEEQRRAAAEERGRKAAERVGETEAEDTGEQAGVATPEEDVADDIPEGRDRTPAAEDGGGTPGTPPPEAPERDATESDARGGLAETVEAARVEGEVEERPDDAPVTPEGREVSEPGEEAAADDLERVEGEDDDGHEHDDGDEHDDGHEHDDGDEGEERS